MEIPSHDRLSNELRVRLEDANRTTRDAIIQAMGTPPNPERVPQRLWDELERQIEEDLAAILFLIFLASANFHAFGRERGPTSRQSQLSGAAGGGLDGQARTYAAARAASLSRTISQSAQARMQTLRRQYQERAEPPTKMEVVADVEVVIGKAAATAAATTETTQAQSAGGEAGIDLAGGISTDDLWITEADNRVCPVCSPLHRTRRPTWSSEFPEGPPAHVRCRCFILYANRAVVGESKARAWLRQKAHRKALKEARRDEPEPYAIG